MNLINSFLGRYNLVIKNNFLLTDFIINEIKKQLSIEVKRMDIKINKERGLISIKLNSIEKSELFINKENLLKIINKEFDLNFIDIR